VDRAIGVGTGTGGGSPFWWGQGRIQDLDFEGESYAKGARIEAPQGVGMERRYSLAIWAGVWEV